LEYSDQQRAAFKDAYAKRLRKQLIMIVLLFAVMAPLPFIEEGATFFGVWRQLLGPSPWPVTSIASTTPFDRGKQPSTTASPQRFMP
jgi:hypothetical protein